MLNGFPGGGKLGDDRANTSRSKQWWMHRQRGTWLWASREVGLTLQEPQLRVWLSAMLRDPGTTPQFPFPPGKTRSVAPPCRWRARVCTRARLASFWVIVVDVISPPPLRSQGAIWPSRKLAPTLLRGPHYVGLFGRGGRTAPVRCSAGDTTMPHRCDKLQTGRLARRIPRAVCQAGGTRIWEGRIGSAI